VPRLAGHPQDLIVLIELGAQEALQVALRARQIFGERNQLAAQPDVGKIAGLVAAMLLAVVSIRSQTRTLIIRRIVSWIRRRPASPG
jgi:hypothetical protein